VPFQQGGHGEGYKVGKWGLGSCSDVIGSQQWASIMVESQMAPYVESWVAMGVCTVSYVLGLFLTSLLI